MGNNQPDMEAIVKKYNPLSCREGATSHHPFAGKYTRLQEPVIVRQGEIPFDMSNLCMTARVQAVPTYAFCEGHRYELTLLRDVMCLDSTLRSKSNLPMKTVRLKAKGHGLKSIEALTNVYHAFISDPESPIEVVENGDSDECQE